ncbi:hypothetical protein SALWKB12_1702 [Snodgrassella communis]|uniref:Uncharacterized protein n=1 Tax=Snodgrassella communis TaxID=2946699 RepID=A0A836MR18_9NEIS|nr:hypothetical protein SALWKB12_1702 [Snodgrassella communis]KDN14653.1 hypothetical protein SALWKB29_1443 [Snodgrassella communis]
MADIGASIGRLLYLLIICLIICPSISYAKAINNLPVCW